MRQQLLLGSISKRKPWFSALPPSVESLRHFQLVAGDTAIILLSPSQLSSSLRWRHWDGCTRLSEFRYQNVQEEICQHGAMEPLPASWRPLNPLESPAFSALAKVCFFQALLRRAAGRCLRISPSTYQGGLLQRVSLMQHGPCSITAQEKQRFRT